jgi:hypothetical protein
MLRMQTTLLLEPFFATVPLPPPDLLILSFEATDDASLTDSEASYDPELSSPQPHTKEDKSLLLHGHHGNHPLAASHHHDDDLMNRSDLKRVSAKVSLDATRREKEESRSKKLAERLVTQVDADESGLANMAKLKAQQSSSTRLAVHHHPPTLPATVTLRDDPMTKTQAFLTCMPDLK